MNRLFTASTTYVVPNGMSDLRIFMIGGGASGFPSHSGAGGAAFRRRGIRGGDLWGHHDDARPAARTSRGINLSAGRYGDRRAVLIRNRSASLRGMDGLDPSIAGESGGGACVR